jgi:hypothetical protein
LESDGSDGPFSGCHFDEERWEKIVRDFPALGARWDEKRNTYVFADGSSLPEPKHKIYRRKIWALPSIGLDGRLIFERMVASVENYVKSLPLT